MNTVYEILEKNKTLSKDAVICGTEKISYKELYKRSKILSKIIENETSENIILFMPNSIHYVVSYFAVLFSNKALYPISSLSKTDEIISAVECSKSRVILCLNDTYMEIKDVLQKKELKLICVDDSSLYDVEDSNLESFEPGKLQREYSFLLNTSGSTGVHKIVMLSQENMLTNCSDWIEAALNPSEYGRVLVAMPASTSFGTISIATCIMLGWTIVFLPSFFNSATLLRTIQRESITHLLAIGSMLNILAMDIVNLSPGNDYNSLKFIGIGGNKAVPETMKILMGFFREAGLSPGYGITEATCIVTAIHPDVSKKNSELFFEKINSAGLPFKNNNIRIARIDGMPDSVGEVLMNGPTVMKGYYNNSLATDAILINDDLHTGDIGYFDSEGYLYLVGRIKNIIKSGGYTIFPEEVEEVLENSSLVKEAYVYGIEDLILDEKIEADIILNAGIEATASDIKEYCVSHLANYKIPADIHFVNSIQKTMTGKIQRGAHRQNG
jgi:long-chain acyl-CoA synthetase